MQFKALALVPLLFACSTLAAETDPDTTTVKIAHHRRVTKAPQVVVDDQGTDDAVDPAMEQPTTGSTVIVLNARPGTSSAAGGDNFENGFIEGERFAVFNPHKKTCLVVKKGWRHKHVLGTSRCRDGQAVKHQSKLTFHWKPAGNNNAYLAWESPSGKEYCASHESFGTRFYPCNSHSTTYTLSATNSKGVFHIMDATTADSFNILKASASCMQAGIFKTALWMSPCSPIRRQGWTKLPETEAH